MDVNKREGKRGGLEGAAVKPRVPHPELLLHPCRLCSESEQRLASQAELQP